MELAEVLAKEYAEYILNNKCGHTAPLEDWVVMDDRTLSMSDVDAYGLAKKVDNIYKSRLIITID